MFEELRAHFPEEAVSWRPAQMNYQKTQAMALAYIDSRDVMARLDKVCGPAGWQSEHYDCGGGRMGCKIGIYCKDQTQVAGERDYGQWIWKSDGAGATQVEGDKGAFSDAFKRAAVSWGVGRYLYDMGATWVPCETNEKTGKFKRFKDNPWAHVANKTWKGPLDKNELKEKLKALGEDMHACEEEDQLIALLASAEPVIEQCKRDMPGNYSGNVAGRGLAAAIEDHKKRVKENQV